MLNTTFLYPKQSSFTPCDSLDKHSDGNEPFCYKVILSCATIIAILSPVAVVGNLVILAVIWKKTFVRTPFHILLSGLAFTDLCTVGELDVYSQERFRFNDRRHNWRQY